MEIETYNPEEPPEVDVNTERLSNLIDFCAKTIVSCKSFDQIKSAGNYCFLAIDRLYKFPDRPKKEEELIHIEGKRDSVAEYFRIKMLEKAKELTPYHSEIPDEEIANLLWN